MKDKVKEQIQKYQQQFDELLTKRDELVAEVNTVQQAMEQVKGAFAALKNLAEEDKPKEKKVKK